jgi:NADH:ubiquinone oxidoreductase subunit 6 (subunit J)
LWDLALIILAVLAAILAVEAKELIRSIIAFLIMCVFVAIIYYAMGAVYASVFQLLIYAGAVSVLLIVTVHTIKRRRTA